MFPFYVGPFCFTTGKGSETDSFGIRFDAVMMAYGYAPMISIGAYKTFAIIWICPEYNGMADFYRNIFSNIVWIGLAIFTFIEMVLFHYS